MILNQEEKNIVRSDDFESREFKVDVSVLSILRNSLYSKKAEAACREISCNGLDAHIEAGIPEIPIEVSLPSLFDPTFKVRDYGKSMSDEIVRDIYSYYGKSTKRDSNKAIGAFGIGKLSPLCISPAFQLTCIQEGIKRIYTIYVNEQNIDQIDLIFQGETDEKTGTEVSFGVKPNEIQQFKDACRKIFRFWPTYPTILNCSDFRKEVVEYSLIRDSRWGFQKNGSTCLVSGPIAYNLDQTQIPNLTDLQRQILNKGLAIFAGIGDVTLQASRESISYTPKTIKFLQDKIVEIEQEIIAEVQSKLNSLKTELEGRRLYRNILTDLGELSVISDLVKSSIKIVVNGEHIFEDFFRIPKGSNMLLYNGSHERNRRSQKVKFSVFETDIFNFLSAEKPIDDRTRLFYDLKMSKKGRIRNLLKHHIDGKNFVIGNELYVFQIGNLKELQDYCAAKGIDFAVFKDINTTVILPKRVRSPNGSAKSTCNCKIYDPEGMFEGETEDDEKNNYLDNIYLDFYSLDSAYCLFSHYGKIYYDAGQMREASEWEIKEAYDLLKKTDLDFADEPIIYVVPVKNAGKITDKFKKLVDVLPVLLKAQCDNQPVLKLNIEDICKDNEVKALKEAVEKGNYQITPELTEIIDSLSFEEVKEDTYSRLKSRFGISDKVDASVYKRDEATKKKIEKYFDSYPLLKHISSYHWIDKKSVKELIRYMSFIDQEKSKKELVIETVVA